MAAQTPVSAAEVQPWLEAKRPPAIFTNWPFPHADPLDAVAFILRDRSGWGHPHVLSGYSCRWCGWQQACNGEPPEHCCVQWQVVRDLQNLIRALCEVRR